MCSAKKCPISANHLDKDYCCEKSEEYCPALDNQTEPAVRQCEFGTTIPKQIYKCPWKHEVTGNDNILQCADGHLCNIIVDPLREACCKENGGRQLCPPNYPVMCDTKQCANGTDYCCEIDEYYCESKYNSTTRPCQLVNGNKSQYYHVNDSLQY